MNKLITRCVMFWCHRQCKKYGLPIFYIKGHGKDYPRYLLFTENEDIYRRMEKI